jgi:hypothetical protein
MRTVGVDVVCRLYILNVNTTGQTAKYESNIDAGLAVMTMVASEPRTDQ